VVQSKAEESPHPGCAVEVMPESPRKLHRDTGAHSHIMATDSRRRVRGAQGKCSIPQGFLKVGSNFLPLGTPLPGGLTSFVRLCKGRNLRGSKISGRFHGRKFHQVCYRCIRRRLSLAFKDLRMLIGFELLWAAGRRFSRNEGLSVFKTAQKIRLEELVKIDII
jgi:hypothetical protein